MKPPIDPDGEHRTKGRIPWRKRLVATAHLAATRNGFTWVPEKTVEVPVREVWR